MLRRNYVDALRMLFVLKGMLIFTDAHKTHTHAQMLCTFTQTFMVRDSFGFVGVCLFLL